MMFSSRYCKIFLLLGIFNATHLLAAETKISLQPYTKTSFSPANKESFDFVLTAEDPTAIHDVVLALYTQDNDLIKKLPLKLSQEKRYTLSWDGKDDQGKMVPDEAYYPRLLFKDAQNAAQSIVWGANTGGEEVYEFKKDVLPGRIEYTLPVASRVLVRSGIKNGPMLRTIIDWEPRRAGFHTERWNGRDADNVVSIDKHTGVAYLVVGYQLADFAVITYGNTDVSYRNYREQRKWPVRQAQTENRLLERNGKIIRSEFYTAIMQQKSPRIEVALHDSKTNKPIHDIQGMDEVLVSVKLHEQDEIYLDQSRYEISFFVDHEFISEEEQGFVPFTWRFSPGRYGIKPGEHILIVNVSGYFGQVGVRILPFTLSAIENTTVKNEPSSFPTQGKSP